MHDARTVKVILEKHDVAVTTTLGAEQALRKFNPDVFDIVVADIHLKGMTGVDLLGRIKEKAPDFPVILITGYDALDPAVQAVKLGAWDYILKPINTTKDLLPSVKKAVRSYRLLVQNRAFQERLRSLVSELQLTEEKERRRFAIDLHDSIGQVMLACMIKLDLLPHEELGSDVAAGLDEIRGMMGQAIDHARALTFQLWPVTLYEVGLEAALDSLAEQMQKFYGIVTEFEDDGQAKSISENAKILLFRAVQELVMDVVKHAKARKIRVSIGKDNGHVRIVVADNGISFDVGRKVAVGDEARGIGLFSIRERLRSLDGQVDIVSKPGQGTRVTMLVPTTP